MQRKPQNAEHTVKLYFIIYQFGTHDVPRPRCASAHARLSARALHTGFHFHGIKYAAKKVSFIYGRSKSTDCFRSLHAGDTLD